MLTILDKNNKGQPNSSRKQGVANKTMTLFGASPNNDRTVNDDMMG